MSTQKKLPEEAAGKEKAPPLPGGEKTAENFSESLSRKSRTKLPKKKDSSSCGKNRKTWRAYPAIFRIQLLEAIQYRAAGLAGAATSIFWALIEITVYTVFFTYADKASMPGVSNGMSLSQVISYTWLGQFLFLMQPSGINPDIQKKIDSGDVGIELCRPMDLHSLWAAQNAARAASPLLWRGVPVILTGLLMPPALRLSAPASPGAFFCFLLGCLGAWFLCFSFSTFMCVIRLNVPWGNGPCYMILLIAMVLGGTYLPLQLWPDFLQPFLLLQPFAGYTDLPMRLYLGTMPLSKAWLGLGLPLFWSLIFLLWGKFLMKRRLKTVVVQGG